MDFKQLTVDFTQLADAINKTTWQVGLLAVTTNGLGWDGDAASSHDGWFQTKAFALGLSWRPASVISVRVNIAPAPAEITLANGQKTTPYGGDVFIRYSPDLAHWSSWQVLQSADPKVLDQKTKPGRNWNGTVRVSARDRSEYSKLLTDYSRRDVPWKSDEEAAVRWILEREPKFFEHQLPFIGYVQFLFEAGFPGGRRIQTFNAEFSYAVSGLHSPPKNPKASSYNEMTPWKFRAVGGPSAALEELIQIPK